MIHIVLNLYKMSIFKPTVHQNPVAAGKTRSELVLVHHKPSSGFKGQEKIVSRKGMIWNAGIIGKEVTK